MQMSRIHTNQVLYATVTMFYAVNFCHPWCSIYTEAKQCFATHDEDIEYFNMRIYIILIGCVYIQQFDYIQ